MTLVAVSYMLEIILVCSCILFTTTYAFKAIRDAIQEEVIDIIHKMDQLHEDDVSNFEKENNSEAQEPVCIELYQGKDE